MSDRHFVLPAVVSAILVVLIGLTACGGEAAPTASLATSVPPALPTVAATAVPIPSPTSAPMLKATAVPVPSPTGHPSPTAALAATPTTNPTDTPAPVPAATPTAVPVPTATTPPPSFDGAYFLIVNQPSDETYTGKTVTFKIGGRDAAESTVWEQGGVDELNLTASGTLGSKRAAVKALASRNLSSRRGGLLAAPLLQAPPLAPHVLVGTASINGTMVPQGSLISAWIDGVQVPGAEASIEASPAASTGGPGQVGQALKEVGGNLVRVWKFDAATQAWTFYDPRALFGSFNSIKELFPGQFYYVVTKEGQNAALNGQPRTLFRGWNPVVW